MKFPKDKSLKNILNDLENSDPTLVIDYQTATKSDILKYKICQEFVKLLKKEKITQVELSKRLNTDKAVVNKIILHKIDHFSIDRLLDLYSRIGELEIYLKAS